MRELLLQQRVIFGVPCVADAIHELEGALKRIGLRVSALQQQLIDLVLVINLVGDLLPRAGDFPRITQPLIISLVRTRGGAVDRVIFVVVRLEEIQPRVPIFLRREDGAAVLKIRLPGFELRLSVFLGGLDPLAFAVGRFLLRLGCGCAEHRAPRRTQRASHR